MDKIIQQIAAREGFNLINTGGGCAALTKTVYVLITDIGGCAVPESINEPVAVGIYDPGTDETISYQQYDSIVDFFKK